MAVDNVQLAQQVTAASGVDLSGIGGLTAAIVAGAMVFASIWGKFKATNSTDSAVTTLYNNLSEQIEKLTKRLDAVEVERDNWQQKAMELEGKVKALESLEQENIKLIKRLDLKDDLLRVKDEQIASLLQEAAMKSVQIQGLVEKVHELELRFERANRES